VREEDSEEMVKEGRRLRIEFGWRRRRGEG
jgi:hypothetical protein